MKGKSVMSSAFSLQRLFLVMAAFVWAVSPGILAAAERDAQHLDGFWLLSFDLPEDQAGGFLPTEIKQITNFTRDGNIIATTNLPSLPVNPLVPFPKIKLSTGHGAWERTGEGRFELEVWRVATCVDPLGCGGAKLDDPVGWANGKATVEVDKKSETMTGTIQLQLFAPDLTTPVLPPAVGTLTGSRRKP